MCRLLYVESNSDFDIPPYLEKFARISKNSEEYQGHGWGCSIRDGDTWEHYHDIDPVWEYDFDQFGRTNLLLVHARSAFENRDIRIENNMPFYDDRFVFLFNGELRGVRIREKGRIGAEKIFNFIKRRFEDDLEDAIRESVRIIRTKTRNLKAMNFLISDGQRTYLSTLYNERPGYFQMHRKTTDQRLEICSDPLDPEGWEPIPNETIIEL